MKKVLLIGADGMLGGELKQRLEDKYEVYGTTIETLDITDKEAVLKKVQDVEIDGMFNIEKFSSSAFVSKEITILFRNIDDNKMKFLIKLSWK